jgi:hypothetical protein
MLENCNSASFAFRRFHIGRLLGIDIAKRLDPVERAVESYLRWMEIVEQQEPLLTLRVEYLYEDLFAGNEKLRELGINLNWKHREVAIAVPKHINSSLERKPEILPDRYLALSSDLLDALSRFCVRYRYPFPGPGQTGGSRSRWEVPIRH